MLLLGNFATFRFIYFIAKEISIVVKNCHIIRISVQKDFNDWIAQDAFQVARLIKPHLKKKKNHFIWFTF